MTQTQQYQALINCPSCHSKTDLVGQVMGRDKKGRGKYSCRCLTCDELIDLPSACPKCSSTEAAINTSGAQYRMYCSCCKDASILFYDSRIVRPEFLMNVL